MKIFCEKCIHKEICSIKEYYEQKAFKMDVVLSESPKCLAFSATLNCTEYLQENNGFGVR